jgi:hypothetical protein
MPRAMRVREDLVHEHAELTGIPAPALLDVDRRSTPSLLSIAVRLGARTLPRGREGAGGFMVDAARMVAGALDRAGAPAPFLVFGHTHVAADTALGVGPRAPRYLNPGTWSTMLRPGRHGDEDRLRLVEIEYSGGAPTVARLARWPRVPDAVGVPS